MSHRFLNTKHCNCYTFSRVFNEKKTNARFWAYMYSAFGIRDAIDKYEWTLDELLNHNLMPISNTWKHTFRQGTCKREHQLNANLDMLALHLRKQIVLDWPSIYFTSYLLRYSYMVCPCLPHQFLCTFWNQKCHGATNIKHGDITHHEVKALVFSLMCVALPPESILRIYDVNDWVIVWNLHFH